ncbi:efflux RND transporter periplasmic adaptor subunit [Aliarcobacter butzleri]|uniref:efflux RND transporter periplasmic adaptor subunit n=1 Tax=Aliarcobacter butzleri TaxID=28197 RepID=UPI000DB1C5F8|nr:biotin/lipoyl-binding protein [Aliarcobacter butzleri]MCG3671034.1 efflux RND transporter periplasmic adaptor subunit [Aliarcobacter butzleri]MCG3680495.1 efflux RND transporter periplasmic adaptor subunit [Aliarcobacter butzleri]MDN5099510.1 efflux RND transporter periplasmic adaptor subunit [Aliarcobacter butzleri]PZP14798.1 MAG: transporter [Aliarcobacter butzleri]RZV19797.1 transporter [Aliarcobacter butzleri]
MKKIQLIIILLTNILFADVYATYEVKALNEASLNVSTSGIVSKINTDIGNQVKKGEVLLSLNDSEEKANLEISKNEYKFLLTQYERYKKSAEVFDKNSLDKLESELKSAKDLITLNEAKLSKMKIIAPFSGVISEKNIEVGDMSNNNEKALLKLVSNEKKLLLAFDSKFAQDVKAGDIFCLNSNKEENKTCVEIYKVYPALNNEKKLNAEAYGVDLKIGNFGDGLIIKGN